jgi:DNA uptake protein ComE-like DNA-binding protein
MSKFFRLPLSILALTIAGPVLAADPPATSSADHNPAAPAAAAKPAASPKMTVTPAAVVDINSATAADLKTLPGITEAEAAKIVQGRPYKEPSDLVSKKILPESEFGKIKDRVTAGHAKS